MPASSEPPVAALIQPLSASIVLQPVTELVVAGASSDSIWRLDLTGLDRGNMLVEQGV
jgi:hypothetical protein